MKKVLLSTALLLSAGTAITTATSLSDALSYSYDSNVYTISSASASAGAVSYTIVFDKSALTDALSSLSSGYFTYATLSNSSIVGNYYYSTSETSNAGYLTGYWASSAWTTGGYSSSVLADAISSFASSSDVVYFTVTTGSSGAVFYVNGTSIYSASGLKSTAASNALSSVTVASGIASAITGFYAFSAQLSATEVSSINAEIAAVPEPSAFGLLAGLGALAFVASRRRRRGA